MWEFRRKSHTCACVTLASNEIVNGYTVAQEYYPDMADAHEYRRRGSLQSNCTADSHIKHGAAKSLPKAALNPPTHPKRANDPTHPDARNGVYSPEIRE